MNRMEGELGPRQPVGFPAAGRGRYGKQCLLEEGRSELSLREEAGLNGLE
jgi:hypothetical protein